MDVSLLLFFLTLPDCNSKFTTVFPFTLPDRDCEFINVFPLALPDQFRTVSIHATRPWLCLLHFLSLCQTIPVSLLSSPHTVPDRSSEFTTVSSHSTKP